jgi:hypothetical protein
MQNPDTPPLQPDSTHHLPDDLLPNLTSNLTTEQIERAQKILHQALTYLRSQSRHLPPEAGSALTYDPQLEADR